MYAFCQPRSGFRIAYLIYFLIYLFSLLLFRTYCLFNLFSRQANEIKGQITEIKAEMSAILRKCD